jgi:tRNA nucleotidyltransferase (CCA-adding enzyme)
MLAAGYRRADREFPVFIHPHSGEEYALARTERKTGPGYRGFETHAGPDVTLEQDLRRRDLTINALALDETGQLIDVCNGREDLDEGLLRHISPAFVEDPVRLLRVARFAAKLGQWGFRVAHGTYGLMKKLAASGDLASLKAERLQAEMWKALAEPQPWRFFEVLQRCGALARLIPELAQVMGGQDSHQAMAGADAMAALKRATKLTPDPDTRFAVAMFQALSQASDPDVCIARMRLTKRAAERLRDLLELGSLQQTGADPELLLHLAKRLRSAGRPERYGACELAGHALWPDSMPKLARNLRLAGQVLQTVTAADLRSQGLQGAALGAALHRLQLESLRKRMANESD